jgi:O-antigen/teichoic acid export membrane protein
MNQAWTALLPAFIRRRLEGRSTLQNIIANTGWLAADQILRMGVGLLVGIWVARYLGPERFGLLNYAIAFVAMFSSIATLGLDGIVVRDIVREPSRKEEILGTAFFLKAVGGCATFLITVLVIIVLRPQDRLSHWLVGIMAIGTIFQAFDTIDFWFQAIVQSKYTVYAKNCAYLLISGAKISLILMHAPLIAFAWAGLAETIIGSAGLVVAYRMSGKILKTWNANIALAKRLLRDSWPLIFSGAFVLINMLIDKIMLGDLANNTEVGLYSAAARLSELWYFIPMMVGASVTPTLIRVKEQSESSYHAKLQQTYNLMTIAALSLALPTTFLSHKLIAILYGPEYAVAAHMLSIHIWTGLFVFHVSIRTRALMIEGKQQFIAVIAFFTMIFNVIFNIYLIPAYGGVGASYASLFSWMLCVFLVPYLSKRTSESVKMFFKSLYLWIPVRR